MTPQAAIQIVESLLAIGLLLWFFQGPWQRLIVGLYRQRLFEARDALFMMAAKGRMEFTDPAYHAMRYRLNDMIRHADHFRLGTVVAAAMAFRAPTNSGRPNLRALLDALPDQRLALHLQGEYTKMELLSGLLVAARSPWLLMIWTLLSPFALVVAILDSDGMKGRFVRPIGRTIEYEMPLPAL